MLLVFIYLTISIYHHQIPNITNIGLTPRKIKKAAIVGGGLMGSGIATVLILNNFKVILKEINEQFLSAGINRVKGRPFFPHFTKFYWDCLHSSSGVCSSIQEICRVLSGRGNLPKRTVKRNFLYYPVFSTMNSSEMQI